MRGHRRSHPPSRRRTIPGRSSRPRRACSDGPPRRSPPSCPWPSRRRPRPSCATTPDQRLLYLIARHQDGLAHLLVGVAERGGFVQLTGEVGTGKTTLCRYLLEHLPQYVDVALILNPMLTRLELLATICDELRIAYPADPTSVKPLVHALYPHLLDAHARGRRTAGISDKAHHLSV